MSHLKTHKKQIVSSRLFDQSIAEIKDLWMQFKTRCDDFWIDYEEFHKVFKEGVCVFSLWDSKENGLVDALELFSCLVMFSKSNFDDKVVFLFEVFDFNGLHCLTVIDIEYLVSCCLTSLLKVHQCYEAFEPEQDKISHLVSQTFKPGDVVNLSSFLKFAKSNEAIAELMAVIQRPIPEAKAVSLIDEVRKSEDPNSVIPSHLREAQPEEGPEASNATTDQLFYHYMLNSHFAVNRRSFLESFIDKVQNFDRPFANKRSRLELKWVYGFRFKDVVHSLAFHVSEECRKTVRKSTEKLLYFSGRVVVVFYHRLNRQALYNEHHNTVSVLAVSEDNRLCATADSGRSPRIHIWVIEDLKTKMTLPVISNSAIYLLKFVNKDRHLVAVTKRHKQPLHVYDVVLGLVLVTISMDCFLCDLVPVFNTVPSLNAQGSERVSQVAGLPTHGSFLAYSSGKLHLFVWKAQPIIYTHQSFELTLQKDSRISGACALFACKSNPELAIYSPIEEFDLLVVVATSTGRLLMVSGLTSESGVQTSEIRNFQIGITQVVFLKQKLVCVLTNNAVLSVVDFVSKQITGKVSLSHLPHQLKCYDVKNLERVDSKRVIVVTESGEVVWLKVKATLEWDHGILKSRIASHVESGIVALPGQSKSFCLLEVAKGESFLFVAGGNGCLYTLSQTQHRVVSEWLSPESMTAIDSTFNQALGVVTCLGCHSGTLFIRVHWSKVLERFSCKAEVVCVKFSCTGKFLMATTRNCLVFLFTRKNGLYFQEKENHMHIPSEVILSLNFNDNCSSAKDSFVILTSQLRNHYLYLLGHKTPIQPLFINTTCNNRLFTFSFAMDPDEPVTPIVLVSEPFFMFCGERSGSITMFDSAADFEGKLTGFHNGHSSAVDQMQVSSRLDWLHSLSGASGELFEWKVEAESQVATDTSKVTKFFYQAHDSVLNQVRSVVNGSVVGMRAREENSRWKEEEEEGEGQETGEGGGRKREENGGERGGGDCKNRTLEKSHDADESEESSLSSQSGRTQLAQAVEKGPSPDPRQPPLRVNSSSPLKASPSLPVPTDPLYQSPPPLPSQTSQPPDHPQPVNTNPTVAKQVDKVSRVSPGMAVEWDSFAYFRSFNNSDLRKIFKGRSHLSRERKDTYKKTFSEYSLRLKYVYGLSSYEFTGMCIYLHTTAEFMSALNPRGVSDSQGQNRAKEDKLSCLNEKRDKQPEGRQFKKRNFQNSIKMSLRETPNGSASIENQKDLRNLGHSSFEKEFCQRKQSGNHLETNPRRKHAANSGDVLMEAELGVFLQQINSNAFAIEGSDQSGGDVLVHNYGRCRRGLGECRREVLYVAGRVLVVCDPLQIQAQRFYEGHSALVSAVAIHPVHNLVASGEIAVFPKVHVWNPTFAFTVGVIFTGHESGVLLLDFFAFESTLVSVSVDKMHSIQVSDWKTGQSVAFRNTSREHVVSVKTSPKTLSCFVTGSLSRVDFWEVVSHNIVHQRTVLMDQELFHGYARTLTFLCYSGGQGDRADILVTSSHGQIGLVSQFEFGSLMHRFDRDIVNVVRTVVVDEGLFLFFGCEDGSIKGFTIGFEKVFEWRDNERLVNPKVKTKGIQSLDFFMCESSVVWVLAMARHGKMIELQLQFQRDQLGNPKFFLKSGQLKKDGEGGVPQERLLVHCHAAQPFEESSVGESDSRESKRVFIALNRERDIMASVGDDQNLFVWDIKNCAPLKMLPLHMQPTAIKFAPNNRLLVGFSNGRVKIYDLEFMVSFDLGSVFSVAVKENPFVIADPDIQTAVLSIELSEKGERLAVSYDVPRVEHEVENRRKETEGFAVSIFQLRTKQTGGVGQDGPYKHFDELRPSILNQFEMSKIILQNMAVHHMSFSEDFVHLLVYLQKMQQARTRCVDDQEGQYILRNVTTQQIQNIADNDHLVSFSKVTFPLHVNGLRLFSDFKANRERRSRVPDLRDLSEYANNKVKISAICDSEKIALMGGVGGEVFLSRSTMFATGNDEGPNEHRLTDMVQAKTYPAHTSFVSQIEMDHSQNAVFTTGDNEECIFQWEIERTEDVPDQETVVAVSSQARFCQDIPNRTHFLDLVRIIHPSRVQFTQALAGCDKSVLPRVHIKLHRVIGRKAMMRRGNLLVSDQDQLVYCVGTIAVVVQMGQVDPPVKPQSIRPKGVKNTLRSRSLDRPDKPTVSLSDSLLSLNYDSKTSQSKPNREANLPNHTSMVSSNFRSKSNLKSSLHKLTVSQHKPSASKLQTSVISDSPPNPDPFSPGLPAQQFIIPTKAKHLVPPSEIACMQLAADRKTVCLATSDVWAVLHFYDVLSSSFLGMVLVDNCKLPVFLRFSVDGSRLFFCGLDGDYTMSVFFVDVRKLSQAAVINFMHAQPYLFRDGQFMPTSNDSFILVGPCQVTAWKFACNTLSFRQLGTRPFSATEGNPEGKKQDRQFDTVFVSVQFVYASVFVCGSVTGHLFLWRNELCESKTVCYVGMPVTVLSPSPFDKGEFLTAGFGSSVKYFRVQTKNEKTFALECLFEVELFSRSNGLWHDARWQVQALHLSNSGMMTVGKRDGSVSRCQLDNRALKRALFGRNNVFEQRDDEQDLGAPRVGLKSNQTVVELFDDKCIVAADFSFDAKWVYCLTEGGLIWVYRTQDLQLVKVIQFEGEAVDLVVLELQILVQLASAVISFDPVTHCKSDLWNFKTDDVISLMRVDPGQRFLCLAVKSERHKQDHVELFRIEVTGLTKVFQSEPQNGKIALVDFSIDSQTLMLQTEGGKIRIFQIGSTKVEDIGDDFDYHKEWAADGLRTSKNLQGIRRHFSERGALADVLRVGEHSVVVVDEMGMVR